jgi:hypothetical protein
MIADRAYAPGLSTHQRASLFYFAAAVPTVGFVHGAADLSPFEELRGERADGVRARHRGGDEPERRVAARFIGKTVGFVLAMAELMRAVVRRSTHRCCRNERALLS